MSFYKRSFHSFLGQTNAKTMPFKDDDPPRQPYGSETRDPGGIGFAEEAHGLTLCTEYLGFESYDMRMSDNEVEVKMTCHAGSEEEKERVERKRRKTKENVAAPPPLERKREFPPPLSSLNGRGQRSFYLRPVRKDGRLELTQVMIHRPEIFQASRENGRLRLHLVDACCDFQETVDVEDQPKGLDLDQDEDEDGNVRTSDLKFGKEINEDNDHVASDHEVVDLAKINDDSGARSRHEVSLNSDDDDVEHEHEHEHEHDDAREWMYKSCCKIVASRNHDENDHHPYHHHNSNNNMHLWTQSYVKTR